MFQSPKLPVFSLKLPLGCPLFLKVWALVFSATGLVFGAPLSTEEPPVEAYSPPITISAGGTYQGNWRSTSDSVPAVHVTTLEPVIIERSHLTGPGRLLHVTWGANVTVRNTSFHGKPANSPTSERGVAIYASAYKNLVVENNFFENTSTVVKTDEYSGDGTAQNTLIVRYNRVRNIIGLRGNGARDLVQFVAIQNYRQPIGNPKDARIAWNEVINTPGISVSEDLINFYKGGGRADGWFKVHDNYLQGSYPSLNPVSDNSSGSGMIVDGPDHNKCAYIEAYNNFVINTTNAGMNIAAGSNIWYHHNRIISTGKNPSGQWMQASFAAAAIWNAYNGHPEYTGTMHNNVVENNVIGWGSQWYSSPYPNRQDLSVDQFGAFKPSNVHLPNAPITQAMQDQEYQTFLQRAVDAGVEIGPHDDSIPPPSSFVYLSDLNWTGTPVNGWGPPEKNRSNGEMGATDGAPLKIRGATYPKGLGIHAASEITYTLNGGYTRFISDIGVDDEVNGAGSVVFQVWADGVQIFNSGTLTGSSAVASLNVSVAGKNELKLIVTDAGNGGTSDHADWADAKLVPTTAPAPTTFSQWQTRFFTSAASNNASIGGLLADPDKDGLCNLIEYFHDKDPTEFTPGNGLPLLDTIGGDLTLTYQKDTAKTDVLSLVEKSTDLSGWNTSGITDTFLSISGTVETRRASIPLTSPSLFLHLKVTKP